MNLLDQATSDFEDMTYNMTGGILDSVPAPAPDPTTIHSYEQEGQPAAVQPVPPQAAQPPADAQQNSRDGTKWVPGVGFIKQNTGNAAMDWEAAAGSPAPNIQAIQKHNSDMLNPANQRAQGGPGSTTPSTQRFYTRKLAREIMMSRGSSPEARSEAHNALRFQGAPSQPNSMGAPDAWDNFFQNTALNSFGEGLPGHPHQNDQFDPRTGAFKLWTQLT